MDGRCGVGMRRDGSWGNVILKLKDLKMEKGLRLGEIFSLELAHLDGSCTRRMKDWRISLRILLCRRCCEEMYALKSYGWFFVFSLYFRFVLVRVFTIGVLCSLLCIRACEGEPRVPLT
jgi:hypothetical protein